MTYQFNGNWTTETIVTEHNLVCQDADVVGNINTVSLGGLMVGAFIFGNISGKYIISVSKGTLYLQINLFPTKDRYGRKWVVVVCSVLASLMTILHSPLSKISVYAFMASRFLMLVFIYGAALIQFVYLIEITAPRYRYNKSIYILYHRPYCCLKF